MTIEIEYEVRCEGRWVENIYSLPLEEMVKQYLDYFQNNFLIIKYNFLMIIDLIHNIKILIHSAWEGAEERAVTN